jgi:hypothetical protein
MNGLTDPVGVLENKSPPRDELAARRRRPWVSDEMYDRRPNLGLTSVAALKRSVALTVVPDLLGVRAEEPAVQRPVRVGEADRQRVRHGPVLHPRSQGIEGGLRASSTSSVAVGQAGCFEHSVVVVDVGNHGRDGVVVVQCALERDEGVKLLNGQFVHGSKRS